MTNSIRLDDLDKTNADFIEVTIKTSHVLVEVFDEVTQQSGEGSMVELSHEDARKLGAYLTHALEPCPECDGMKRRHNCRCRWHPSNI